MDVLSASAFGDKVALHAGDGARDFGGQQLIAAAAISALCAAAADLDGDRGLDVLWAARKGDAAALQSSKGVVWYENLARHSPY